MKTTTGALSVVPRPSPAPEDALDVPALDEATSTSGLVDLDSAEEQMFIDLTRRAPAPALGATHWWG